MAGKAILLPVFLQVYLTLGVLVVMGVARRRSMRERGQSLEDADLALGRAPWSDAATKAANNFRNQFELPILFYLAAIVALQTRMVDTPIIVLAWVFALSRVLHAIIHLGPNVLRWRGTAYLVGFVALTLIWLVLAARILTGNGD